MLYPRGKVDVENSINYKLIKKGFAKVDEETFSIPSHLLKAFQSAQEQATSKGSGIWKHGGEFNEEY